MARTMKTMGAAVSSRAAMAYVLTRNAFARRIGDERGQVGSIVLIGVLVVLAIVAGILIFNAVSHSAHTTASCISSPSSCANAAP